MKERTQGEIDAFNEGAKWGLAKGDPENCRFIASCHAMQGLLASGGCDQIAKAAVEFADELLTELAKEQEGE